MRMSEMKRMEVINVCDGKRLGFVGDVVFDEKTGCIRCLVVPGPGCFCGILGREKDIEIPYENICQFGDDIILVQIRNSEECGGPGGKHGRNGGR